MRLPLSPSCAASNLPPNEYDDDIRRARQLCLDAMDATTGWSPPSVSGGISISTSSIPNNPSKATRGEGTCSSSALLLFSVLGDPDYRTQWDPMIEQSRILRSVDRLTRIAHSTFKAPWPLGKREMVIVGRGQREDDGSFFSFATSVPYPELPCPSGIIRASLLYYGVRFYPTSPTSCRFRYVACSDPFGYLPKAIVNLAATVQPQTIGRLDRLLRNKPELGEKVVRVIRDKIKEEGFDVKEMGAEGGKGAPNAGQKEGVEGEGATSPRSDVLSPGGSLKGVEGEEEGDGEERKTEVERRREEEAKADDDAESGA